MNECSRKEEGEHGDLISVWVVGVSDGFLAFLSESISGMEGVRWARHKNGGDVRMSTAAGGPAPHRAHRSCCPPFCSLFHRFFFFFIFGFFFYQFTLLILTVLVLLLLPNQSD